MKDYRRLKEFLRYYERLDVDDLINRDWIYVITLINTKVEPDGGYLTEETELDYLAQHPFLEDRKRVKLNFIQLLILSKI